MSLYNETTTKKKKTTTTIERMSSFTSFTSSSSLVKGFFYQRRKKGLYSLLLGNDPREKNIFVGNDDDDDDDDFPFPADLTSMHQRRIGGVRGSVRRVDRAPLQNVRNARFRARLDEQSVAIRVRHVYGVRDNHVVRVRGG